MLKDFKSFANQNSNNFGLNEGSANAKLFERVYNGLNHFNNTLQRNLEILSTAVDALYQLEDYGFGDDAGINILHKEKSKFFTLVLMNRDGFTTKTITDIKKHFKSTLSVFNITAKITNRQGVPIKGDTTESEIVIMTIDIPTSM